MTETDGIRIEGYVPGPVEVWGRRLKMEYVGMASVFTVIAVLIYGGAPWLRTFYATGASFFLFLGLKKKNRDHLMCSMHLFGAALLARAAVLEANWALPLLFFGATVFSAERYIEKRPQQVSVLPLVLGVWAWFDGLWILGLIFSTIYLLDPREDRPDAKKILIRSVARALVAGAIVTAFRLLGTSAPTDYWLGSRFALSTVQFGATAAIIVGVMVVLFAYRRRLIIPHRVNPVLFAVLAPWDVRLTAMFAMAAAVLFAASVFKLSIDSDRIRPYLWHAEWHYFYIVLGLAVWAILRG